MKNIMLTTAIILHIVVMGCSSKNEPSMNVAEPQNSTSGTGSDVLSDFLLGHQSNITSSGSNSLQTVAIHLYHPDSTTTVSGGAITVNGSLIPRWTENGTTWYQNKGGGWAGPLVLDGSFHVFNVPGGPGFPAFTDSVRSPGGATTLLYPTAADSLSRSAGATIQWTPSGGVDGVVITIRDTSKTIGSKIISKELSGNPGSLHLSAMELSVLKPGPIMVRVYCGNSKNGVAGSGQKYRITVFSSQGVRAWLKN